MIDTIFHCVLSIIGGCTLGLVLIFVALVYVYYSAHRETTKQFKEFKRWRGKK